MASQGVFVQTNQDEKDCTCADTKGAVPTKADFAEVSGDATAAYPVAQQEHQVRWIAVHLIDTVCFFSLSPCLISSVPLHHSCRYNACDTHKYAQNVSEKAENRVSVCGLFPICVWVDLKACHYHDYRHEEAQHYVGYMHNKPISDIVALSG